MKGCGPEMSSILLYEKSGLKVTASGHFTKEELEVLEYEIRSTMSGILKFRKFGGDNSSK